MAPPMGALKVAAIPAATPEQVRTLTSLAESFMALPIPEPVAAPMRAMGPSLPALPPLPRVIAELKMRTSPALFRMSPLNLCRAVIM